MQRVDNIEGSYGGPQRFQLELERIHQVIRKLVLPENVSKFS